MNILEPWVFSHFGILGSPTYELKNSEMKEHLEKCDFSDQGEKVVSPSLIEFDEVEGQTEQLNCWDANPERFRRAGVCQEDEQGDEDAQGDEVAIVGKQVEPLV